MVSQKSLSLIPLLVLVSCSDNVFDCNQSIIKIEHSPDNSKSVYWVARDCGATTAPLTMVSILPESEKETIDSEGRNISKKRVFMSFERGLHTVKWTSENTLEVFYDHTPKFGRKPSFIKQKHKLGNIQITYRKIAIKGDE